MLTFLIAVLLTECRSINTMINTMRRLQDDATTEISDTGTNLDDTQPSGDETIPDGTDAAPEDGKGKDEGINIIEQLKKGNPTIIGFVCALALIPLCCLCCFYCVTAFEKANEDRVPVPKYHAKGGQSLVSINAGGDGGKKNRERRRVGNRRRR